MVKKIVKNNWKTRMKTGENQNMIGKEMMKEFIGTSVYSQKIIEMT